VEYDISKSSTFCYKDASSRTIEFDPTINNSLFLGTQGLKLNHQAKFLNIAPLQMNMDFLGLLSQ
jgi:hypothetical protein